MASLPGTLAGGSMTFEAPDIMITCISNQSYEGERPLFAVHGLRLDHVRFLPGESALKECSDVEAVHCEFMGKYPLWHNRGVRLEHCVFREGGRAAIWYAEDVRMRHTLVEAPKMFRNVDGLTLEHVSLPHAAECCWHCSHVQFRDVQVKEGDYLMMHGHDIVIKGFELHGNYSFQYARGIEIRDAVIRSKDAFWNSEDVTVYDSVLDGEYLGWHSKNLKLVNCSILGTQPLCYADNLVLENCTLAEDCDLCFEYSSLDASIKGTVTSVRNPRSGRIVADGYGDIIMDGHCPLPGNCSVETRKNNSTGQVA